MRFYHLQTKITNHFITTKLPFLNHSQFKMLMSNQVQSQQVQQNFTRTLIPCSPPETLEIPSNWHHNRLQTIQNSTNLTTFPSIFLLSSVHNPDQIHKTSQTSIKCIIKQTHGLFGKISTSISATLLNILSSMVSYEPDNISERPLLLTNPAFHIQSLELWYHIGTDTLTIWP